MCLKFTMHLDEQEMQAHVHFVEFESIGKY